MLNLGGEDSSTPCAADAEGLTNREVVPALDDDRHTVPIASALLHRVGLRGQRLTSKHTINEYRVTGEEFAWLRDRGVMERV